jgi:hypothetical protein
VVRQDLKAFYSSYSEGFGRVIWVDFPESSFLPPAGGASTKSYNSGGDLHPLQMNGRLTIELQGL